MLGRLKMFVGAVPVTYLLRACRRTRPPQSTGRHEADRNRRFRYGGEKSGTVSSAWYGTFMNVYTLVLFCVYSMCGRGDFVSL